MNMEINVNTIYTFIGGVAFIVSFFFIWMIRLLKGQSDSKIEFLIKYSEIREKQIEHGKDIESLKEKTEGGNKKIEELTVEVSILKTAVQENGLITKSMKEDLTKLESKLDRVDKKLDTIILNLSRE